MSGASGLQARPGPARAGRRPVTTRAELEQVALDLFAREGFDATTVDDIARAAGIGRRTFFRYYASKNDVVWGDFDAELATMRAWLAGCPPERPVMDCLHDAMLAFNDVAPEVRPLHRRRMALITNTAALQAHSTLRYAAWRDVVAGFVAERTGAPVSALGPQVVGHALLGVALAAYEQWLGDDDADLLALLDAALAKLAGVLRG